MYRTMGPSVPENFEVNLHMGFLTIFCMVFCRLVSTPVESKKFPTEFLPMQCMYAESLHDEICII